MKIAVLDDYQRAFDKLACRSRLDGHDVVVFYENEQDTAKLADRLQDFDAIILSQERTTLTRRLAEKLPRLRVVALTGSHREQIDAAACTELGIAVVAIPNPLSYTTIELTWALILASVRHIPEEVQQLKAGKWQTTIGTRLQGKTLGIYGLGKLGTRVAAIGSAFGMKISCWGRAATASKAAAAGYHVPESRQAFFEGADVLTLHIRLSEATTGIITAADLACMKPSALLVNTSRARLIEEGALVEALNKGRPGFAAIDVFEHEPVLGGSHPLLKNPRVLCTPHLGGIVWETYEYMYGHAVDNILAFASGNPVNVFNPDVLTRLRHH